MDLFDPVAKLGLSGFRRRFHWETGALFVGDRADSEVLAEIGDRQYDVVWVDHGRYTGPKLVRAVRDKGMKTVVLNVDDPFGYRDRLSWLLYRKTVKEYDLVVVVREPNVAEAKRYGAKDVLKVWRAGDEVAHRARDLSREEIERYQSDVLFLGTWMVGRGAFLKRLIDLGVNVTIIGDRWNRAPEWPALQSHWKAPGVYEDADYAGYIQCAKVCIGLLSDQNRDLHTTRTAEIPLIGSLFCAQRTTEHLELYQDGVEAVFWDDADECARLCKELLADPARLESIARAGHERCLANGTLNERVAQIVLERLCKK